MLTFWMVEHDRLNFGMEIPTKYELQLKKTVLNSPFIFQELSLSRVST